MLKRFKLILLKFELFINIINSKLPRLLRVSKWGILTTFISLILATSFSVSYAASDEDSNLKRWKKEEIGVTIINAADLVAGHQEYNSDTQSYEITGSLLVATNNLVVDLYENNDQVSGVRYMADRFEDAGIVQPAYAQIPGFRTFQPVLNMWKVVRNLVLQLVIVIGLIISVMILLRVQRGQGYVNLINSLPKILISIILILSSYSIAGFLLDLGNVTEKLFLNLFYKAEFIEPTFYKNHKIANTAPYPVNIYGDLNDEIPPDAELEANQEDFNVFRLLSRFANFETWGEIPCGDREQPDWYAPYATGSDRCPVRAVDIIRTPTNIGTLDRGSRLVGDVPVERLLQLIFTIVIITSVIKIFFSLVSSFAKIVLYTIFAPVVFLFFPIAPKALSGWMRYFLASSLVFPVAFLMMFIAAIICGDPHAPWFTKEYGATIAGFAPNLLTYSTSNNEQGIPYLTKMIALVIVLMIPFLEKYLMEVLKVPENMMLRGAKESIKGVASKIPVVGSFANM